MYSHERSEGLNEEFFTQFFSGTGVESQNYSEDQQEFYLAPKEFSLEDQDDTEPEKPAMLGKRDSNSFSDSCGFEETQTLVKMSTHSNCDSMSKKSTDFEDNVSQCSDGSVLIRLPIKSKSNSAPAFLQPTESLKSQSDKTDLKRFSEITLKLLRRAGDQGLQKQKIEDQFREELTQEAVNSMSDNYCLRRRLNLILTVLKSPAIGLIEESRDPYNKKIKIIRLTKKNRNDENSKMMALVEDKSAAVTQKQQQHQDLQHKFMILRETIEKNKRKNQNSVSVGVMSAQGGFRFIRQPESTSPKFSLLDQTISSETKVLISATNSNTWQVLSKTPIQLMSVCDRLMNN